VNLVFDGRTETLRALLDAFPADAPEADAELALAVAVARLYDGLLDDGAAFMAVAERSAATVPDDKRRLFALRLSSAKLWLASRGRAVVAAPRCIGQSRRLDPRSKQDRLVAPGGRAHEDQRELVHVSSRVLRAPSERTFTAVPSEHLVGTAWDARVRERAGAECRKGIPCRDNC
jgi:hypothetical protein